MNDLFTEYFFTILKYANKKILSVLLPCFRSTQQNEKNLAFCLKGKETTTTKSHCNLCHFNANYCNRVGRGECRDCCQQAQERSQGSFLS